MIESPTSGSVVVYGAGTHGRVVGEAATLGGRPIRGFVDDGRPDMIGLLSADDPDLKDSLWVVGVGNNTHRMELIQKLKLQKRDLATVIHPTAFVAPSAILQEGVFVGPNAVVHTNAKLGEGVIVNSGAIVEHDCVIEDYAHVAPGVVLGGGVHVGQGTLVGIGARVLPRKRIGNWATVGSGAVVVMHVENSQVVTGIPAQAR